MNNPSFNTKARNIGNGRDNKCLSGTDKCLKIISSIMLKMITELRNAFKFMVLMLRSSIPFTDKEQVKEEIQLKETANKLGSDTKTIIDGFGKDKTCQSGLETMANTPPLMKLQPLTSS